MELRLPFTLKGLLFLQKAEPILALMETSKVITVICHKSPFRHFTHFCSHDILGHIEKDEKSTAPSSNDYISTDTASPSTPHLGKRPTIKKLRGAKW